MRAVVALYLLIGLALLAIGFFGTGPCPERNTDFVSNAVFVLTWPVGIYAEVYQRGHSAKDWLHGQACGAEGGPGPGPRPLTGPARRI